LSQTSSVRFQPVRTTQRLPLSVLRTPFRVFSYRCRRTARPSRAATSAAARALRQSVQHSRLAVAALDHYDPGDLDRIQPVRLRPAVLEDLHCIDLQQRFQPLRLRRPRIPPAPYRHTMVGPEACTQISDSISQVVTGCGRAFCNRKIFAVQGDWRTRQVPC
jgi:hypothetical protein